MRRRRPIFQLLTDRRLLAAVDIPDDLSAAPAAVVTVPVNIDDAAGVRGAEIRLSFDPDVLQLSEEDVAAGSVWDGQTDTEVIVNIDNSAGTVVIFVSASAQLGTGSGSLVDLEFEVDSSVAVGETSDLDLTSVVLNEGQVSVSPTPISGSDQNDGLFTVTATGDDSISGFVFADANGNGQIDSGEAIGGVTITLTNNSTDAQVQVETDSDGAYQFTDLAAGSYTLTQTQPTAFAEGGANTISLTLTTGSSLEDQNFIEGGLLPQYFRTRLLSTSVMPVGSTDWATEVTRITTEAQNGTSPTAPVHSTTVSASAMMSAEVVAATSQAVTAFQSEAASDTVPVVGLRSLLAAEAEFPELSLAAAVPIDAVAIQEEAIHEESSGVIAKDSNDEDRDEVVDRVFASGLW
ncbi:carboxypeptidase regulatory-like domain-containing protein [Stieleria sp. JC731]|uniref:cohesin domain-containing protein n=1 Tax=Pirellulaceae TaxID=2691357 RepID=UPI001E39D3EA|nr:SdrD B-like domain-containing protein [Stieleria sp. JC731]MCC9601138.1 carboxypeptidase regulatory-like domain-containing protein [Stieleria sp. JC731]